MTNEIDNTILDLLNSESFFNNVISPDPILRSVGTVPQQLQVISQAIRDDILNDATDEACVCNECINYSDAPENTQDDQLVIQDITDLITQMKTRI